MSNATSHKPAGQLIAAVPAANDDDIGASPTGAPPVDETGGWDAYEVWRRFIKEARERRRNASDSD